MDRDTPQHEVSDDESDGIRKPPVPQFRLVEPGAADRVPACADEFDVFERVDDAGQFPGALGERVGADGQTTVLVPADKAHVMFVLGLGEYAEPPIPNYKVTERDWYLFQKYMELAHMCAPNSQHLHARERLGGDMGTGGWCCIGHLRAAVREVIVKLLDKAAADALCSATPSEKQRRPIIMRAEQTLVACNPKLAASLVLAGAAVLDGPVLPANANLVLEPSEGASARPPVDFGIAPETWVQCGFPVLPPPPPGFAWAHADPATAYEPPEFLTAAPRYPYLTEGPGVVNLATGAAESVTLTAVVTFCCPWEEGPVEGPYHSPFFDDACENTGLSITQGTCCIAPARQVECIGRDKINGVVSSYGPVMSGVPECVLVRLMREERFLDLGSVDGGLAWEFVVYVDAHKRSLLVDGISTKLPEGGDAVLRLSASTIQDAELALFGPERTKHQKHWIYEALGAPKYERKRCDFSASGLSLLYFRCYKPAARETARRRLQDATAAMRSAPSPEAGNKLRNALMRSAPFAAELQVERAAATHAEYDVLIDTLSAKLGFGMRLS
jgi:hypothetical protein